MRVMGPLVLLGLALAVCAPATAQAAQAAAVVTTKVGLAASFAAPGSRASVGVAGGRVLRVQGWLFEPGDEVGAGWSCRFATGRPGPRSLLVTAEAPAGAALRLATHDRAAELPLDALRRNGRAEALNGEVRADLLPTPHRLSGGLDAGFPAMAAVPGGAMWAAWVAFDGRDDCIGLAEWAGERWENRGALPRAKGRIHSVALCALDGGRLLAVWSQERRGAWDLYRAVRSGGIWGKPAAITHTSHADLFPRLAADGRGTLWLAWQSIEGSASHIRLASWQGGSWSHPLLVSERQTHHWAPALAVGPEGRAYVAWDSHEAGQYDVYLRAVEKGCLSPIVRVTDGPEYEANASLACDTAGRLWIAYDRGEAEWGRGAGAAYLHRRRALGLRCFEKGRLTQPPLPPTEVDAAAAPFAETPRLFADVRGQVWIAYRRTVREGMWDLLAQRFDGQAWSAPVPLPDSAGRSDMPAALAGDEQGRVWAAWATDARDTGAVQHSVCAAPLPGGFPAAERVEFAPVAVDGPAAFVPPPRPRPVIAFGDESGSPYQGELCRYTELAPCHPFLHGSLLDACRYALDVSGCDFTALTDPAPSWGSGAPYRWRLQQTTAALFSTAAQAAILTGYECALPGGGRGTVLFSGYADLPAAPDAASPAWWRRGGQEGALALLHVGMPGADTLPKDPEPLLLMLPEPGDARPSAEDPAAAPGPLAWLKGAVARAYAAGGGHGETRRLTYVWADGPTRSSLAVGLRLGRTYAGPAGAGVSFSAGKSPIGSRVHASGGSVPLRARVTAASPIRSLEILCDGRSVHSATTDGSTAAELTFAAPPAEGDAHAYVCRAVLADGSEVLSSPIWVAR